MLISVAGALAVTAVLFIGADRTVDSALNRWSAFTASIGAVLGLITGAVLQHNGWVPQGPAIGGPFSEGWLAIVISGLIVGGLGLIVGRRLVPTLERRIRLEGGLRPWVVRGPGSALRCRRLGHPRLSHHVAVVQKRAKRPGVWFHHPALRGDLHRPHLLFCRRLDLDLHQPPLHSGPGPPPQ